MAKKKTPLKRQAADYPVPQDAAQANDYIERIGVAQRKRERLETEMNDALAVVKARFEESGAPIKQEIEGLAQGLQTWAAANRDKLTCGGRVKFNKFAAGMLSWRARPPKVSIKGVADVTAALIRTKLKRFLRFKTEIDKEAMLKEPDVAGAIDGVTIGSAGEVFVIAPFESELEEVVL